MIGIDRVYILEDDMPSKCIECPFVNSSDECILQDNDANFMADSWDDLQQNCPLVAITETGEDCPMFGDDGKIYFAVENGQLKRQWKAEFFFSAEKDRDMFVEWAKRWPAKEE